MNEITVMANWSLLESKIENELLAKDFADCVVYLSSQGCTVAVPSGADGLTETQVAQITDAVLSNTEMTAAAINGDRGEELEKSAEGRSLRAFSMGNDYFMPFS